MRPRARMGTGSLLGVVAAGVMAAACSPTLMSAATSGNVGEIRQLLDSGASPNESDRGETPLMMAALAGHVDVVKLLLERGADANLKANAPDCLTALMAASAEHADVVELLLPKVSDVNYSCVSHGWNAPDHPVSALSWALKYKNATSVRLLLAAGADPTSSWVLGDAEKAGDPQILTMLQAARATRLPSPVAPAAVVGAAPAAPATRPAAAPSSQPAFVSSTPQPAAYALIIGIERYRDVPAATGARADAETFATVARTTFGLREDHIRLATEDRATRTDVLEGLQWLRDNASAGGRVYFFFSGHGAPSTDSSTYLLPYDGSPKNVARTAVAMSDVMAQLGQTKAREVVAFVDSCFSGAGGRSVLPPGARPLMRVNDATPAPQMALFVASRGDEISGPAPGESAGAFTKYLTMGLGLGAADINGDGQVSLQELSDWVSPRVAQAAKTDSREQHPKLVVGSGVGAASNFIVEYGLATK